MKNKTKKTKESIITRNKTIFTIQLIVGLFTVGYIYYTGLLPLKYNIIIAVILLGAIAISGVVLFKSRGWFNNFVKIMNMALSLVLVIGCFYASKGVSFIDAITGAEYETHVVSVIVDANSQYMKLEDVKAFPFSANTSQDKVNVDKAVELFEKEHKFTPSIDPYETYEGLQRDLLNGTTQVMLLSENHRMMVEQVNPEFSKQTRIIEQVSYTQKTNVRNTGANVLKDTFTILISGIDTYGPVSTVASSDVNMLVTVDPKTNQILLTSIPRDYHVELGTIGEMDKLTYSGIYGINETVTTVEKLLDIDVDFYVRVNFSSVETVVDALGGVTVESKFNFNSTVDPSLHYNVGKNDLNGYEALMFARERKAFPRGDEDRVVHQQELMKGIINSLTSPSFLLNYTQVLSTIGDSIETNMSDDDLTRLIRMQIDKNPSWDIQQNQLVGTEAYSMTTHSMTGWNQYVFEPIPESVAQAKKYIEDMEAHKKIEVKR
ncbi:LCP family protein [Erysipelothrix anatis]|uniref:LCP family protein n=1 Tax=Erysipelothrix anatis TaxID=2683713 RepID=UPI001357D447|nr:LCP family protein [Erysipelothrix anatis]